MKPTVTLIVLLCTLTTAFSQPDFTKEYGINATEFVNLFLSFNDNEANTNEYLFTFKKIKEDGKAFRMGLGLRGNTSVTKPDVFSNFDKRTNTFFDADLRMGTERQIPIKGNWAINGGFDGKIGYATTIADTDGDKLIQTAYYAGLGPVAGIQYRLNDRIGFLTETSFNLFFSNSITKEESDNNNFSDSKNKTFSISYGTTLPTNLIFFVRF